MNYILRRHTPIAEPDVLRWAEWFEIDTNRLIAADHINETRISTVFLAIDHTFGASSDPVLFETMVFNQPGAEYEWQARYTTWKAAIAGHAEVVRCLKANEPLPSPEALEPQEHVVKELAGKIVESVWIHNAKQRLALVFVDGSQQVWQAEGDCCAHAWIEAVEDLGFKGPFVTWGDDSDRIASSAPHPEHDVLDINFYCFRTERGRLLVELRTSHNGYYSGRLTLVDGEIDVAEWKAVV